MFTMPIMQTATAHNEFEVYLKNPAYGAVQEKAPQVFKVFGYGQRKHLRFAVVLICFVNEMRLYAMFTSPTDPKILYLISTY